MNKTGLFILGIVIGLIVGFFAAREFAPAQHSRPSPPDVHHYFYRVNDSMIARHTVMLLDSGMTHRVDTLSLDQK